MHKNEEMIRRFYTAFARLDYKTMQESYAEGAIFNDPVFGILDTNELKSMWKMLCTRAKEFSLEYSNIELLDDQYATCNWKATYIFSATGRRVINEIKAHMRIIDGKITEHSDAFKISKWSAQALGWKGRALGWTGIMQRKIRAKARKSLTEFMEKEKA